MRELKPTTIRVDDAMRKELERVAGRGGVTPAGVIRMCMKYGLPIVEHGFEEMNAFLEQKLPQHPKQK